jgi:hypothetical protein
MFTAKYSPIHFPTRAQNSLYGAALHENKWQQTHVFETAIMLPGRYVLRPSRAEYSYLQH